jgi:hypothetical protein
MSTKKKKKLVNSSISIVGMEISFFLKQLCCKLKEEFEKL